MIPGQLSQPRDVACPHEVVIQRFDFQGFVCSLMRELEPRKHMMEEMGAAYMAAGIVTLAGSRMYTSMADTDEVIDEALERFETVLSSVEGVA